MRQPARIAACAVLFAACAAEPELAEVASEIDVSQYPLPMLSTGERADVIHGYDHIDPTNVVPRGLLEDALVFYDVHQARIPNSGFITVVDLSLFSGKDRFWLVDMATGAVEPHKVSHGSGSDPEHDGYANTFSNVSGSNQSSLGFSLTAEIYNGTHQHSMRLDGLSPDGSPNNMANTRMRERLVVVHEASYVDDANDEKQGRSNGCPALDPSIEVSVVDRIYGGSLFYIANGTALNEPVGRTPDPVDPMDPPIDPPADDPGDELDAPGAGGCSTSNGSGLAIVAIALGVMLRRWRSRS